MKSAKCYLYEVGVIKLLDYIILKLTVQIT